MRLNALSKHSKEILVFHASIYFKILLPQINYLLYYKTIQIVNEKRKNIQTNKKLKKNVQISFFSPIKF